MSSSPIVFLIRTRKFKEIAGTAIKGLRLRMVLGISKNLGWDFGTSITG